MAANKITTVANSSLWVAAASPLTFDAAGFLALTWVKVGEVTDIGTVMGREYNTSSHAPIDTALQVEKKASYKLGNAEFKCGWDESDAGQVIVQAASLNTTIPSFKVLKSNGAIRYFTAQVSKFIEELGTVDNVVQGSITLLRQTDTVLVAAV
jgi:hypothetical protein